MGDCEGKNKSELLVNIREHYSYLFKFFHRVKIIAEAVIFSKFDFRKDFLFGFRGKFDFLFGFREKLRSSGVHPTEDQEGRQPGNL
jgi:hypothetical protein